MSLTFHLYYTGTHGNAAAFVREMEESGTADRIRREVGNLQYEFFQPLKDADTILLIDSWRDQEALDAHHASSMMKEIAALREKYDLHMKVERFVSAEDDPGDAAFVRQ